jgi:hypothetical protein
VNPAGIEPGRRFFSHFISPRIKGANTATLRPVKTALTKTLVLASVFLTACPPPIDTGTDGSLDGPIVVGPEGGLFIRNGFGVEFPPNSVAVKSTITVTIVDTGIPEVPMRKRVSFGYRFSPSTLKLNVPIKVFLPWIDDRVPQGVENTTFDMRRNLGTEAFTQLPGARTNTVPVNNVEAQSDKLGLFWVTSPTEASVDRLVITPAEANVALGINQQFTAQVVSPTGAILDVKVTWSSLPPRVGTIDANGLFTAKGAGVAIITAKVGMKTATAKAFVRSNTSGPATFTHQNPFPTGNDLYGGAFAPLGLGTLFCGDNGTILARDSSGKFSRLFSSPGITFKGVGGTTMNNAIALGNLLSSGVLVEFMGTGAPAVKIFQPTQVENFTSLWFDGTFGMGVGTGNNVVIRRNNMWVLEVHPSFETLLSVLGDGAGGFLVVGDLGSIYRWDEVRRVWDSLYDTRLSVKLDAAKLINVQNGEAWAVGGNRLWHFDGATWVSENLPGTIVSNGAAIDKTTSVGVIDGKVVIGGSVKIPLMGPVPENRGFMLVRKFGIPPIVDSGIPDAGMRDAGTDSGIGDAGISDAGIDDGSIDSGIEVDAGAVDSGFDAGTVDAGDIDSGIVDAGFGDAGDADAGATDAGPVSQFYFASTAQRGPQIPRGIFSNQTQGYVVGDFGSVYSYNFATESFSELSRGFYGEVVDLAVLPMETLAAVNECADLRCKTSQGRVMHQIDGGWSELGFLPVSVSQKVTAIAARSNVEVLAATEAGVFRWNGTSWQTVPVTNPLGSILDIKYCGTQIWAVGEKGAIYKGSITGFNFVSTVSAGDVRSLWCQSATDIWVAGDGFMASSTGAAFTTKETDGINQGNWNAVYSPGQGEGMAFGQESYGLYWDTRALNIVQSFGPLRPEVITGLWGSAFDNLYAVGLAQFPAPFGFALRFDGINWSLVDSGAQRKANCVDGSSGSNIWIGTVGGGVLKAP